MFRGTTPVIRWKIADEEFNFETIEQVWMTFQSQGNEKDIITKDITEIELDPEKRTISYSFSQEETLKFKVGITEAQLRVLLNSGNALATEVQTFKVDRILKGGVIQ